MAQIELSRIAVIDDHFMFRTMLAEAAGRWANGQVVLEANGTIEYAQQLKAHGPIATAIVVLSMPQCDGFDTMEWIHANSTGTRILALTFDSHDEIVHRALLAGAHAILGRDCQEKMLHEALDALHTTGRYVNGLLLRQLTFKADPDARWSLKQKLIKTLPPRVLEFGLHYVGEDSPSREEVAERMDISPHTAEDYRKDLFELTGAHNRLALLYCFIRFGLKSI